MIHTDVLELAGHIRLPHSHDTGQGMAGKDRGQTENAGSKPLSLTPIPLAMTRPRKCVADRRDKLTDGANQKLSHN